MHKKLLLFNSQEKNVYVNSRNCSWSENCFISVHVTLDFTLLYKYAWNKDICVPATRLCSSKSWVESLAVYISVQYCEQLYIPLNTECSMVVIFITVWALVPISWGATNTWLATIILPDSPVSNAPVFVSTGLSYWIICKDLKEKDIHISIDNIKRGTHHDTGAYQLLPTSSN